MKSCPGVYSGQPELYEIITPVCIRQEVRDFSIWVIIDCGQVQCPFCILNNTNRIHFIFAHLIKQLQKVCRLLSLFQNLKKNEISANSLNF